MDSLLARLPKVRLLVVGDVMLDCYLWGDAARVSPEAPVPVVQVEGKELRLGGAANVVSNLCSLGVQTQVVGLLGQDEAAESLKKLLKTAGADTSGLVENSTIKTTVKTRVMARHQQLVRFDSESIQSTDAAVTQQLWEAAQPALAKADGVIVSDYAKGAISDELLTQLTQACSKQGLPLLVDPKGQDYARYRGASCITPNEHEAARASGVASIGEQGAREAAQRLIRQVQSEAVCITLGQQGVLVLLANGEERLLPTLAQEVFDVTGAGDTFIAVLAASRAAGAEWFEAVTWGNRAAGMVVSRVGASSVNLQQLATGGGGHQEKLVSDTTQLAATMEHLRSQGKTIVFTNGCFDWLHAGHVLCLETARAQGDVLVVGLNSDQSVRKLKGAGRPFATAEDRARVLCSLACVDYVSFFDADTPRQLILQLRPHVLAKGADYTTEEIVGHDLVSQWGGRLVRIPLLAGRSSSRLIKKQQACC